MKENKTKEELIFMAAEEEFLNNGYAGATTQAIARKAGVTHAMLHYYFRTKENLFKEFVQKKVGKLKELLLARHFDPDAPFCEKIRKTMEAHLELLFEHPDLPVFAVRELISEPEVMAGVFRELGTDERIISMKEEMEEEVRKGNINDIPFGDLIIDIVMLNLSTFLTLRIRDSFPFTDNESRSEFIEKKKKENTDIIMNKLRK